MSGPPSGPDGFPIVAADPLGAAHESLNGFLVEEAAREAAGAKPDDRRWKKLPKRQAIDHLEAILRRLTWLREHDRGLQHAHVDRLRLVRLLRVLYSMKLPCTERDLCTLLDLTAPLLVAISPEGPVEYLLAYTRENDLTPALCVSLHNFEAALREEKLGAQASLQSLRQTLHVLLWLDEWERLDPSRCWSECVRRDLRAMTGERQSGWRRLMYHIRGNVPKNMPAGWAREAEELLARVGLQDFKEQFALWWAPFRSGQPLPLSVAGSHVLKGLLWYASLTRDEEVKEIALWLLDVKWKQKRNVEKSMVALEVFGITRQELEARQLVKPDRPSAGPGLLERVLKARLVTPANRVVLADDDDLVIVQGDLHYYRLHRSTGRIERATDDAVLELDWHAMPDDMRSSVHQTCDSPEQLMLRAHLLMHDSAYGRYFRPNFRPS
jgi:hypothetical protein